MYGHRRSAESWCSSWREGRTEETLVWCFTGRCWTFREKCLKTRNWITFPDSSTVFCSTKRQQFYPVGQDSADTLWYQQRLQGALEKLPFGEQHGRVVTAFPKRQQERWEDAAKHPQHTGPSAHREVTLCCRACAGGEHKSVVICLNSYSEFTKKKSISLQYAWCCYRASIFCETRCLFS